MEKILTIYANTVENVINKSVVAYNARCDLGATN